MSFSSFSTIGKQQINKNSIILSGGSINRNVNDTSGNNYTVITFLNSGNIYLYDITKTYNYLMVGGGGAGGRDNGGGGGGGGVLQGSFTITNPNTINITVGNGGLIYGGSLNGQPHNGGNTYLFFNKDLSNNINIALGGGFGASSIGWNYGTPSTTGVGSGGGSDRKSTRLNSSH